MEHYRWCEICGDNVLHTDDDGRCPDCGADDNTGVLGGYHSHDFHGRHDAWSKAHNGRLFGVELEVECGERIGLYESAEQTAALHEDIVLETDGSLDHGYEIITQPRGMDTQRAIWRTILAVEPSQVRGLRSHNTTTCGLHVHVSRAGISSFTLAKAVVFVNDPANESLIWAIARRYAGPHSNGGYAKCKTKKLSSALQDEGDRYQAVNLCTARTVEFRIFRGSLNYRAVIAAVQFCHTLLSFAETASASGLTTDAFIAFIGQPEQRADSDELRPYLAERVPHLVPQSAKDAKSLAEKASRRHHASNHVGRYAECPHCANDTGNVPTVRAVPNESEI